MKSRGRRRWRIPGRSRREAQVEVAGGKSRRSRRMGRRWEEQEGGKDEQEGRIEQEGGAGGRKVEVRGAGRGKEQEEAKEG
jgi:hypothetical protein